MLFIDPDHCTDCEACMPECPVEAIFHETMVPENQAEFIALNREMSARLPVITERAKPLASCRRGQ